MSISGKIRLGLVVFVSVCVVTIVLVPPAFAGEKKKVELKPADVIGKWGLDEKKSKNAPDGNTAGLMADVEIKEDGTFVALYGTKGTWKIQDGKMLISYDNRSYRSDEEASMDGEHLKFPSPAQKNKYCYLKKKK